jgi:hypothetical protein
VDTLRAYEFQLEHQHNDGSWSDLDEDRSHHGAAAHDPERGWIERIFRCSTCSETVRLKTRRGSPAPDAE